MSLVVTYLASPLAAEWIKWTRLDCLCASISLLKKFMLPVPVIVFHEDYTNQAMDRLLAILPDIKFEQVDFSTHTEHYVDRHPTWRTSSYGYCMMCRFFSGVMQAHPALAEFTHYMRLDDDSYIVDTIPISALARMHSYDYSYNSVFHDPHATLWHYALEFMSSNGIKPARGYTDNVPYNNFHASSLALWNHPIARKFIDGIEYRHGCVKHGWTDSSVHAVLALVIGPAIGMTVNFEHEFSYRHNQQCIHAGPHTPYCTDGLNSHPTLHWGPPPADIL